MFDHTGGFPVVQIFTHERIAHKKYENILKSQTDTVQTCGCLQIYDLDIFQDTLMYLYSFY